MEREAAVLRALGDPTRLRLAVLLAIQGETCVCELAAAVDEPPYKVSRHLGVLRSAGLVEARREGAWMHYQLVKGSGPLEKSLQACFRDQLKNHKTVREDLRRLRRGACKKGD
jgi:ArsR family transcriptional regulator